jgi:RNA polymerase sigma-70 factor (ECF subfamily)
VKGQKPHVEEITLKVTEVNDLVNTYGIDIYKFCRQLTRDKEEADELYQGTFLKALEICEKIDNEKNPKSFLLSIAIKLWKNRKRKYAWRERIASMENYQEELDYSENQLMNIQSPEEEVLKKEDKELIIRAVASLKKRYRVPMYLYYAAEVSLKEISHILKLPEGTVKSRLYKARKEVKKYLEVNGYGK